SPSTSTTRGRGQRATTPRVVTSPEIPAPIPHASPHPETLPPMVDASLQPKVPSPTPLSQPNFDLGIDQNLTPPILPKTPLYPPTSSSAPIPSLYTEHHYPPTSSSSDPLGPLVGIDTLQPHTDVLDKHLPHQPSSPQGRPQRIRRAPTCGIGGHKIGHQGKFMVLLRDPSDENVIPVVEELQRRLPPANAIPQGLGDGKEYPGGQNDVDAGEEDGLKMSSSSEEDISEKNWKDY
ncbi:magnesium transporter mrs2-2, partial [Quercus suber]